MLKHFLFRKGKFTCFIFLSNESLSFKTLFLANSRYPDSGGHTIVLYFTLYIKCYYIDNTVYQLLCNLIGPSTSCLSLHILLVVKKNEIAERFVKVNEQEIRELLDNTTPKVWVDRLKTGQWTKLYMFRQSLHHNLLPYNLNMFIVLRYEEVYLL